MVEKKVKVLRAVEKYGAFHKPTLADNEIAVVVDVSGNVYFHTPGMSELLLSGDLKAAAFEPVLAVLEDYGKVIEQLDEANAKYGELVRITYDGDPARFVTPSPRPGITIFSLEELISAVERVSKAVR